MDNLGYFNHLFLLIILILMIFSVVVFVKNKKKIKISLFSLLFDDCYVKGGISGLYAGLRLAEAGCTNIVLYEASDRIGGRMKTVQHGIGFSK